MSDNLGINPNKIRLNIITKPKGLRYLRSACWESIDQILTVRIVKQKLDGGMKHLQIRNFYHLHLHPRS